MNLLPTSRDENRVTTEYLDQSLKFFDRTPSQQADVNLTEAIRVLEFLPVVGGVCLAIREIRKVPLLATYQEKIDAIEDILAVVNGTALAPCGYVPHPMVVARAELRNAQMYLRRAA